MGTWRGIFEPRETSLDIALDESKLKVQIEFSARVQCGWYRGFYLDNFRPGILKYPGAFCFPRDAASEIPQGYTRCHKKHGISGERRENNGTGKRCKEVRNSGTCRTA